MRYTHKNEPFPIQSTWVCLVLFWLMVLPPWAYGDYMTLSGAENAPNIAQIHINDDHVKIVLEIFIQNLPEFMDILPEEFFQAKDMEAPPLEDRLKTFSMEGLQVVTGKGKRLVPSLVLGEPRNRVDRASPMAGKIHPLTKQLIPGPPKDKRVYYAELIYPFSQKPKTLTFIPPLDKKTDSVAAPIGFATFHKQAIINYFNYLSRASTIRLDWEDPWYSSYENKTLQRKAKGGVSSFIYIEPFEVRHEILARVKDVQAWMDLELKGDEFIEPDENETLKRRVGQFFLDNETLLIDGKKLRPILDRTAFVKYTMTGSSFLELPERLPLSSARIGVIITYLTKKMPQRVETQWNLWSDRIQKIPSNAIDPAGPFPSSVTPGDNAHVWQNFLKTYKIPTIEKVLVSDSLYWFKFSAGSVACIVLALPLVWVSFKKRKHLRQAIFFTGLLIPLVSGSILLIPYTTVSMPIPGIVNQETKKEEIHKILHSLLKNIYRSFDFREEEDVYDKLSVCVSGEILTDIYLQNRKSFEVKQAGGARAKVNRVEIHEVETLADKGYFNKRLQVHTKWSAQGSVGHWGHIHTRKNMYDAIITLEPLEGAWKIIDLELLEEKRVDPNAGK